MESGGMVAIVQGSKHAGLTVTVLPDTHRSKRRYLLDVGIKTTRGFKSNVETNTEWISKNSNVWDVRYDSRYQFANCFRSPSSQQRNAFLGNGSGEMEQFSSGSPQRDSVMYHGRSSCTRPAHHMVSFMQSLRQYPRAASSAELVQRVLDHVCTKHHAIKHSKGTRSSLKKSSSQHTHRTKKDDTVSHKNNASSEKPLDRSASVIGKRCSSQEELLKYTYDYLKSWSLHRRRTDVRCLTEMKRGLKDRLRGIIDSKPTVCPNIQSRYVAHKKRHCGINKHTLEVATNTENQERLPSESKASPNLVYGSSYTSSKYSLHKVCFCQPSKTCVCQKSHEVNFSNEIKDWLNTIPVYPNFSEYDKIKLDQMLEKLTNTIKELLTKPNFSSKAKKEIMKFLNAIPMWHPNDSQEDALFKEQFADNLIEKLGKAAEAIFEEEFAKDIEELPLDFSSVNMNDINKIKEKFTKRLRQIAVNPPADEEEYKKALKLEDLPLKYESQKPETKSEIEDKRRLRTADGNKKSNDVLRKVKNVTKTAPKLAQLNDSESKESAQFLNNMMNEYDPENLEDIQQKMQEESKEWLDNTTINENADSKTKEKLEKTITQELQTDDVKNDYQDTLDLIEIWFQRIPELSGGDKIKNNKALQDLATQLDEILTSGEDAQNIQVDIRETIADWLQNMIKKNNGRLSLTMQENLVNKLVKKINDAPKQKIPMQRERHNMYDDVISWIKDIPGIDSNIELYQSNAIEDLMNTLNDIRNNSDEELVEQQTKDALNRFIENLIENVDVAIDPRHRQLLEQKLLKQMKRWDKKKGFGSSTPNTHASRTYSLSPELLGSDKIKNNKIPQDFATQLDEIFTSGEDAENIQVDIRETIADWLQNTVKNNNRRLSLTAQENLVNKLVKKINDAPKQKRPMQRERDNMYDDVVPSIKDIPDTDANIERSQSNAIEDLMNTLNDIRNNNDVELVEQQTRDALNRFIENLSENVGVAIDPRHQQLLEQKLLRQMRRWDKKNDFGSSTPNTYASGTNSLSPELLGGDRIKNNKALQDLATQLYEIFTSGEDAENVQVDIRETIADWLQNMIKKNNKRLSLITQENLVNKLVKKINDAPKQKRPTQKERHNMYDYVVSWIKDIPGIGSNIERYQSNAIEDLMKTLNYIRNNSDEELLEQQTKDALNRFIENLSENVGIAIDPRHRMLLERKLLRQMKRWDKQGGFGSSTPNTYASGTYSLSPELSAIHNVSMIDGQAKIEKYINTLNNQIDSWIKNLELMIGSAEQRNLVHDIASDVVDRQKYLQLSNNKSSEADELEHLKYQIFRKLNKFNLEDLPRIISRVNDLNKTLLSVRVPELIKTSNRFTDFTRNINNLVNSIKMWLDNIPTDLARSYDKPNSDDVFVDLAQKLVERKDSIDHYHIKNEILQWLPKLFNNLNTNTLNNLADSLKSHLMNDLAQSETTDVTPGLMYMQTLWDTISKTLPSIHMTSADDLHAFDLLKERLVDAFINLHYFADDMIALDKFKTKLFNEVNKFCNEYLKRYPEPPMDSEEIGKNLYNALRKVSVPDIETVRSELEQVRLKEEILDWLSEVPIDESKNTEPEINAMASALAKRLHGLEKEKHRDLNKDEMKHEIKKWLQELPLRNKEQIDLEDYVDKLMDKLQSTDKSRTLSISKIGKYDDNITSSRRTPQYPRSNLSVEDRAHLERIRRRIDCSRENRTRYICRDTSVSPPRKESGIQTHPSLYERSNMVNREISPQVIIKEYYWDSTSSNISERERTVDSHLTCSPCSPCSRVTDIQAQLIKRISQRTKDTQTEAIDNFQRSKVDKICDKRSCSLGTIANRRTCLQATAPPCYFPEERRTYQRINLPSKNRAPRRSKVDTCCNCGQRIYTNCRGRHNSHRPHCNLTCLKYCVNCSSGCPYPSNLYFNKEFY